MLEVHCTRCGEPIWVPRSMAGGITTCEACGTLVDIPGAADAWLVYLLLAGAAAFVAAVAGVVWWGSGSGLAAGLVLGIGLAIIAVIVLAS